MQTLRGTVGYFVTDGNLELIEFLVKNETNK